ncbi:GNAT family N-acetyltransferase [Dyadobacter sp. CY261]|uniref:GNAT family N-acetyltransferase n=1 Tax=Dyadobacter sp. CY261 TaxID=2907203 RepID=UPI001F26F728|nr:GNAT family N-acetyltransferase [Dyadobacter sp. CY261]MCF0071251.1 GNAT family N-acetyltransferase [Dyadobacter sp. CY261]
MPETRAKTRPDIQTKATMQTTEIQPEPFISHAEPVLAVNDVAATVKYWHEVLGFPGHWTWGTPPNHGGVNWHGAFIQFSRNAEAAERLRGQCVWLRVKNIRELYQVHQELRAEIIMPLAKQPWGFEEYVVKDLNGNYVTFAAPSSSESGHKSEPLPTAVRVVGRMLTIAEYRHLAKSVGWASTQPDELLQKKLDATLFIAVAENAETGEAIGCALVLGDGISFFYIKDVMVHEEWQRKKVGSVIMKEVKRWLDANAPEGALVGLFTAEGLAPFYRQTGFGQVFGMIRIMDRSQL